VASTSVPHDLSSGDVTSSSQVISQHLVAFRWGITWLSHRIAWL